MSDAQATLVLSALILLGLVVLGLCWRVLCTPTYEQTQEIVRAEVHEQLRQLKSVAWSRTKAHAYRPPTPPA